MLTDTGAVDSRVSPHREGVCGCPSPASALLSVHALTCAHVCSHGCVRDHPLLQKVESWDMKSEICVTLTVPDSTHISPSFTAVLGDAGSLRVVEVSCVKS